MVEEVSVKKNLRRFGIQHIYMNRYYEQYLGRQKEGNVGRDILNWL